MNERGTDTASPLPRPSAARARILDAADRLFYSRGIRAVGVDLVISEAGVTRVTFYRHFRSKDQLIAAYLQQRLRDEQDEMAQLRLDHPADPRAILTGIAKALEDEITSREFRGCPYANLTAEYSDEDHPARSIAAEHRAWLLGEVKEVLRDLGVAQPDVVAEQLAMLRAGVMAVSSVRPTLQATTAFTEAWKALIDRALTDHAP